jgi:predicted DNA-binding WGR domain protein
MHRLYEQSLWKTYIAIYCAFLSRYLQSALCSPLFAASPVLLPQLAHPRALVEETRTGGGGSVQVNAATLRRTLEARNVMMELAYLEKVDPSRRMMRFYAIWIAPTLFGEWAMVREWGRIGSPGRLRESWFETEKIANQAGMNLKKRKQARGYKPLASTCFRGGDVG